MMKTLRYFGVCGATVAALVLGGPVAAHAAAAAIAPGTPTRPVLSPAEAAPFTPADYLRLSGPYSSPRVDPWRATGIPLPVARPDFVVGAPGTRGVTHTAVQTAVNAAFRRGGTERLYLKI